MTAQANNSSASSPKETLLAAALDYAAHHGMAGVSLRHLADAIGSSHRMLIHHFGSKEALLVAMIRAVEQQQRDALAELRDEVGGDPYEIGARLWKRLIDPSVEHYERLFFEVYGQALQGQNWARPLLDGIVDDWIAPLTEMLVVHGVARPVARAEARLSVAVARGLLLDLLATGDRKGVQAAMDRFRVLSEGRRPQR